MLAIVILIRSGTIGIGETTTHSEHIGIALCLRLRIIFTFGLRLRSRGGVFLVLWGGVENVHGFRPVHSSCDVGQKIVGSFSYRFKAAGRAAMAMA